MSKVRGFVFLFSLTATAALAQTAGWTETSGVTSTLNDVRILTGTPSTPPKPSLEVGTVWPGLPSPMVAVSGAELSVAGDVFAGLVGTATTPIGRTRLSSNANEGFLQWNVYYAGATYGLRLFDVNKPGWDIAMSGVTQSGNGSLMLRRYAQGNSGAVAPVTLVEFTSIGATFSGTVRGTNIEAHYQDVAEWVPATNDLQPGTVVVLNATKSNEVMASTHAYDSAVAGVVSPAPGLILGERGDEKEMIATTGRVRVKVDARRRPVKVGDLLTTSDLEGAAMASEPIALGTAKIHRPGTILGKALEPLAEGVGEVLVLLTLQ